MIVASSARASVKEHKEMRTYAQAPGQGGGDDSLQQEDMGLERDSNRVRHRETRVREGGGGDGNEDGMVKGQAQQRRRAWGKVGVDDQGQ